PGPLLLGRPLAAAGTEEVARPRRLEPGELLLGLREGLLDLLQLARRAVRLPGRRALAGGQLPLAPLPRLPLALLLLARLGCRRGGAPLRPGEPALELFQPGLRLGERLLPLVRTGLGLERPHERCPLCPVPALRFLQQRQLLEPKLEDHPPPQR